MPLTMRQRMLVHIVVQRFDRESQTTILDPKAVAAELSTTVDEAARDVDALLAEGYVTRPEDPTADDAAWVLEPTDRAVLSAMGLE